MSLNEDLLPDPVLEVPVNVSDAVNATTRAGGIIDIYGDPDERNVKNVIGGKINFK